MDTGNNRKEQIMPDTTLSEALKEAYASAPSDVILLHTLELRHPSFVDEQGNTLDVLTVGESDLEIVN